MLKKRFISGLVIATVLLLGVFVRGGGGAALFSGFCMVLIWLVLDEYASLASGMGFPCQRVLLKVFGAVLVVTYAVVTMTHGEARRDVVELFILAVFLAATALRTFLSRDLNTALPGWLATIAGMGLVYGTLSFILRLYFLHGLQMEGRYLLLLLLAVTKGGDMGAFALGVFTAGRSGGNHKLWPRLSPHKSWEGLIGGVVASVLAGWLALLLLPVEHSLAVSDTGAYAVAAVAASLLTITGLLGDLTESALKRAAGAKDSGRIPGLGGVFDFVDSLVFNAPLFYLFLAW